MLKKSFIVVLVLTFIMTTLVGGTVFGAGTMKEDDSEFNERRNIERIVIESEMAARDYAFAKIEKMGGLSYLNESVYIEDTPLFKELYLNKLDETLKIYDIKRITETVYLEGDHNINAVSPPSDQVDIQDPQVYASSSDYFIKASVYWKKEPLLGRYYWQDHMPLGFGTTNIGGGDGLGIYFFDATNLDVVDSYFYTYDENYNSYNNNLYPFKSEKAGEYYKVQATANLPLLGGSAHSYTVNSMHITVWPRFTGDVDTIAKSHYSHTWSKGTLEDATISNTGINVTFTNSEYAWSGASKQGARIRHGR